MTRGRAQPLKEGALLMLSPRGGRVDNGWWTGDELCHQTRGLKDGPPERYQSCLDQDVRLPRPRPLLFLLSPLCPALRPSSCFLALLPPLFSPPLLPPFLPHSITPFVLLCPLSLLSLSPSLSSLSCLVFSLRDPLLVTPRPCLACVLCA